MNHSIKYFKSPILTGKGTYADKTIFSIDITDTGNTVVQYNETGKKNNINLSGKRMVQ